MWVHRMAAGHRRHLDLLRPHAVRETTQQEPEAPGPVARPDDGEASRRRPSRTGPRRSRPPGRCAWPRPSPARPVSGGRSGTGRRSSPGRRRGGARRRRRHASCCTAWSVPGETTSASPTPSAVTGWATTLQPDSDARPDEKPDRTGAATGGDRRAQDRPTPGRAPADRQVSRRAARGSGPIAGPAAGRRARLEREPRRKQPPPGPLPRVREYRAVRRRDGGGLDDLDVGSARAAQPPPAERGDLRQHARRLGSAERVRLQAEQRRRAARSTAGSRRRDPSARGSRRAPRPAGHGRDAASSG